MNICVRRSAVHSHTEFKSTFPYWVQSPHQSSVVSLAALLPPQPNSSHTHTANFTHLVPHRISAPFLDCLAALLPLPHREKGIGVLRRACVGASVCGHMGPAGMCVCVCERIGVWAYGSCGRTSVWRLPQMHTHEDVDVHMRTWMYDVCPSMCGGAPSVTIHVWRCAKWNA